MNLETLIGKVVRQFNRRLLEKPIRALPVPLPLPEQGKRYLLYLHVPFCHVLCPFCSFHRVKFEEGPASGYFDCLQLEIERASELGYVFDEVYVGGGTPTVLPDRLLDVITGLRDRHPVGEVSVETNPNELNRARLEQLAAAGVSRLSIGVQSFDDQLLRGMQRLDAYGNGEKIESNIRRAAGVFDTLNIDMIFNQPQQSEASLRRDLDVLIDELGADQVSFYPIMLNAENRAAMVHTMGRVDESRERGFYELIVRRMLDAGYTRNSAWCFSRKPGMFDEYIVDREEYLGLGSGAFSYLQGSLYTSTFSNEQYRALVGTGKFGTVNMNCMTNKEQKRYYLLVTLFSGALDIAAAEKRFGGSFRSGLFGDLAALKLVGAIRESGAELRLTERGYYLWVVLMREFFGSVNRLRESMRQGSGLGHLAAQAAE